ncbi:type II toxin-antitoxin system VapC family toxin [Kushneria konosiri]|uniref:Ribonuclease VapC n=1 Tax=Kushneria konosiri TaxID=698828 RepID=A0A2Z2H6F2_9GAMM|nr:type II toxin-antitoxin system VapC family toxin [Kushneria konosiri]ARS52982.1 VapC toxin family PIN domain ribonuclease [Kushneria konosiri]
MIVLDTNVLSELMRPTPNDNVVRWLDGQTSEQVFVTAITVAEILHSIARLPAGARRQRLGNIAAAMFEEDLAGRILSFDADSAVVYSQCVATRENSGRPISMADAQIAAICLQHQAALATRNLKDFEGLSMTLHDPWQVHQTG